MQNFLCNFIYYLYQIKTMNNNSNSETIKHNQEAKINENFDSAKLLGIINKNSTDISDSNELSRNVQDEFFISESEFPTTISESDEITTALSSEVLSNSSHSQLDQYTPYSSQSYKEYQKSNSQIPNIFNQISTMINNNEKQIDLESWNQKQENLIENKNHTNNDEADCVIENSTLKSYQESHNDIEFSIFESNKYICQSVDFLKTKHFKFLILNQELSIEDQLYFQELNEFLIQDIRKILTDMDDYDVSSIKKKRAYKSKNSYWKKSICVFCNDETSETMNSIPLSVELFDQEFLNLNFKRLGTNTILTRIKKIFIETDSVLHSFASQDIFMNFEIIIEKQNALHNILNQCTKFELRSCTFTKYRILHTYMHEFLTKQMDLKNIFLPECISIILLFLKSKTFQMYRFNRNFFIIYYSLYFLNSLFAKIDMESINENQECLFFHRHNELFRKTLTFLLRIHFIYPMVLQLNIEKMFLLRYLYIAYCLFQLEIQNFFGKECINESRKYFQKAIKFCLITDEFKKENELINFISEMPCFLQNKSHSTSCVENIEYNTY